MNHFLPTPFFLYFPHTTQKGENRMNLTDNYTEESKKTDNVEVPIDTTSIPFVLFQAYTKNHSSELKKTMGWTSRQEILDELSYIRRELKRPIVPIQKYAKTKHAAAFLDVDPSFLDKKRKEGVFNEGEHYYRPDGCTLILWDIEALACWVSTKRADNENATIINNMFK
jgi:hypothetical protein